MIAFNAGRVAATVWAGWFVTTRKASRYAGAAAAGVVILVVDHVLLKGGWFLIEHIRGFSSEGPNYLLAFGGVLVSFVMFSPVGAAFGLIGGSMGLYARERVAA